MELLEVNEPAVVRRIAELGEQFTTYDVSDSETVRSAHPAAQGDYHPVIGKWLSIHSAELGIEKDGRGYSTQIWRKIDGNQAAGIVIPEQFEAGRTVDEERLYRKQRLAATFRLFGKFGFDEGVAGHVTARDPENLDMFWVNPFGKSFKQICVSDLILVSHTGEVVEGDKPVNAAAFAIHSQVHAARPDVVAAAHTHSVYGKSWSSLGRLLDPITQDVCAFYGDHGLFDDYTGVVLDLEEGRRIGAALGDHKAVILRNHGLLTVGHSVEEAAWWFVTMERSCQAQLLAEAAGTPVLIDADMAARTAEQVGSHAAGRFSFQPLWDVITAEQPDLFD